MIVDLKATQAITNGAHREKVDDFLRVLVVEDEQEFTFSLEQAINEISGKCSLRSCGTGREAISFLECPKVEIDIALIDIGLPDMSGLEVIKFLRTQQTTTPVLVVTSRLSRETFINTMLAGANGYLLKDADIQEMSLNIKHTLRGNSPISPQLTRFLTEYVFNFERPRNDLMKKLSRRELELLKNISAGLSFQQCAHEMNLQTSTVHAYSKTLYKKLDVRSKSQAVLAANEAGLLNNRI